MSECMAVVWSPFATNILDVVGKDLCTPDGQIARLERRGMAFALLVDGEVVFATESNVQMSYRMNTLNIGLPTPPNQKGA